MSASIPGDLYQYKSGVKAGRVCRFRFVGQSSQHDLRALQCVPKDSVVWMESRSGDWVRWWTPQTKDRASVGTLLEGKKIWEVVVVCPKVLSEQEWTSLQEKLCAELKITGVSLYMDLLEQGREQEIIREWEQDVVARQSKGSIGNWMAIQDAVKNA
jgi:hypothetical protein